ncbi:unnamed protein product [Clonostachys byssicola]|uniref:FAD dependent oxidoreductase domain-containing protein n=1 Tax=Clonostachys byssicola TaxID=160290 RepID=A0A9N9UJU6_9HYPO|nr:unnamed protein product [Clonostachys byssicola]
MAPPSLPHEKSTQPFWLTAPENLHDYRSTESLPNKVDIVIVGGGYCAAALITHVLEQSGQNPPSILVLEARQLASGATGRNGGHIKPDPYWHASHLVEQHGFEAAMELAQFETDNLNAVKAYVEKERIDCDLIVTRSCDVHFSHQRHDKAKAALSKFQAAGVRASQDAFEVGPKYAETVSGVKGAKGCITFPAAHLWPYKLVHHLFQRAVRLGVNLQSNTPVLKIADSPDSAGRWTLATARGKVSAAKVVVATNAYTAALLPEYKDQIIPYRATSCHITTSGTAPLLTNTYALRFTDWDHDYLIPRPDGSIIVGGARSVYYHDKDAWYNNSDDSTLVEEARKYFDDYMQRHFIGWEDSGAHVEKIWTGIMGYSRDRLPRVGPIPGRQGMFIMAGWTGHGMPQIFLSAKGMASMIVDGISFRETGIPRIFEETQDRLTDARNKVLETWEAAFQPKL